MILLTAISGMDMPPKIPFEYQTFMQESNFVIQALSSSKVS